MKQQVLRAEMIMCEISSPQGAAVGEKLDDFTENVTASQSLRSVSLDTTELEQNWEGSV